MAPLGMATLMLSRTGCCFLNAKTTFWSLTAGSESMLHLTGVSYLNLVSNTACKTCLISLSLRYGSVTKCFTIVQFIMLDGLFNALPHKRGNLTCLLGLAPVQDGKIQLCFKL